MPEISTDFSRWPLVIVTPPKAVSDPEMEKYMDFFSREMTTRAGTYAVVLDLRVSQGITRRQRGMLTSNMARYEDRCRGVAMVFDSKILRGILTAIFWVKRPAYPTRVFSSVVEAMDWTENLLQTAPAPLAEVEPEDVWSGPLVAESGDTGWVLQSTATTDREKAFAMLEEFRRAGVQASIETRIHGAVELFVVRSRPFRDREFAMQRRDGFSQFGFDVNVVGLAKAS